MATAAATITTTTTSTDLTFENHKDISPKLKKKQKHFNDN